MLDKRLVFKEIWRQEGRTGYPLPIRRKYERHKKKFNEGLSVLEQYLKVDPGWCR